MRPTKIELCKILDCSKDTLQRWITDGLPKERVTRNKRHLLVFDLVAVAEWLAARNKHKYLMKIHALTPAAEGLKKSLRPETTTTTPAAEVDTIEQLRAVKDKLYLDLYHCDATQYTYIFAHFEKAADQLRKWEKEWSIIQLSQGRVIDVDEHKRQMIEMAGRINGDLRTLPKKAAGLLVSKTEQEVFAIMIELIEDALRHLSGVDDQNEGAKHG